MNMLLVPLVLVSLISNPSFGEEKCERELDSAGEKGGGVQEPEEQANIGGVNSTDSPTAVREHYDQWAADYERDLAAVNYRLPAEMAGILSRHVSRNDSRILDAGAGTGLSGKALAASGYTNLVGVDNSEPMLRIAEKKGAYQGVLVADVTQLPFGDDEFDHTIAVGTVGVAPPETMEELCRVTGPGGLVIFSNRTAEHYADGARFVEIQEALEESGKWELVEKVENLVADDKEGASPFIVFVYRVL